jgi:hypothetical protein
LITAGEPQPEHEVSGDRTGCGHHSPQAGTAPGSGAAPTAVSAA